MWIVNEHRKVRERERTRRVAPREESEKDDEAIRGGASDGRCRRVGSKVVEHGAGQPKVVGVGEGREKAQRPGKDEGN